MILSVASKRFSSFFLSKSLIDITSFPKKLVHSFQSYIHVHIQSILMQESELIVRRIKEGTVIDHIDEGKGLSVLNALEIDGKDGSLITLALNVPSGKFKKKDIIKVENRFLRDDDTSKLAVIAPKSTVNIIKDYKLVEKRRVSLPNEIDRILSLFKSRLYHK